MFDLSMFPINAQTAYTVAGAAAICVLLTQLLKSYLADWRFTNLIAWCVTFAAVEVAGGVFSPPEVSFGERLFNGFLISLGGVSIATFGFEVVTNLLGKAGVGPRSDKALANQR